MRKIFLIFTIFVSVGCAGNQQAQNTDPNKEKIIAKNKQTATLNEVTSITQTAQKIEKEGRAMESYRYLTKAADVQRCNSIAADEQKQVQELADRITKLPENYKTILTPITDDLNDCVSCTKKAMDSCVKARASINGAIKQLYF